MSNDLLNQKRQVLSPISKSSLNSILTFDDYNINSLQENIISR
jgi:hypothetical protein